jgi:hypothetical protein
MADTFRTLDIIDGFTKVESIEKMPLNEICSYCWLEHYDVMQRSEYSGYDEFIKSQLEYSFIKCDAENWDASIPESPIEKYPPTEFCASGEIYKTVEGDTCDKIALSKSLSSAALYQENPASIANCSSIPKGTRLCLPLGWHTALPVLSWDEV